MLKSVELNFTETGQMTLPTEGITIFVGPNNSGKSLLLREIEQAFEVHPFPSGLRIVVGYSIDWPTKEDVEATLATMARFARPNTPIDIVILGRLSPSGGQQESYINKQSLFDMVEEKQNVSWIVTQYLKWGVIRLDGRSRFDLTNDQQGSDLLGPPQNVLMHLFTDDAARAKVRGLVKEAFGLNFVIDPTSLGNLRIRLSRHEVLADEQSLNEDARKFHSEAIHIKEASDGVQAFTGIVTAVCSGEFHTILIDEPEAFLHPPLARKLGKSLAGLAAERGGSLMASTHSSDFLMGCVQASPAVTVVRLEYNNGKSRARRIDPALLETFFKKPLMRSANVVSGLFHDGVIVCESDNDRAFYSEIYYRLAATQSEYPSILFINAQNKQTIRDIIGPLRQFGVPAAAIPDIDVVKDGGKTWTDWLAASQVPTALHNGYGQQRAAIKTAFEATGKDMKSDGGIDILTGSDKAAAEELFDNMESYGIFTVRRGELEHWLPHLGVAGAKTTWTVAMLERLGSDPSDQNYVNPGDDDVWEFFQRIVLWIRNSGRKGTS